MAASPPPPAFNPTGTLTTPSVQVPQEPQLANDPGPITHDANANASASNGRAQLACATSRASANAPVWWMNGAAALWKLLPILGIGLALVLCVCTFRNRRGGGCRPGHDDRNGAFRAERFRDERFRGERFAGNRRRPSWAISRYSFFGRGLLWSRRGPQSQRRRPPAPPPRRAPDHGRFHDGHGAGSSCRDSTSSLDECCA